MITRNTDNVHIKLWIDNIESIEPEALQQAENLASLPFAFHHIAIMPDVHVGYGMPIGGVLATKDVIIPNAVGVDIGCGMHAIKTNIHSAELSTDDIKRIMGSIREKVPTGFEHHKEKQYLSLLSHEDCFIYNREYMTLPYQVGTLGGGNHFIEIQKDEEGFIWVMVHSGSRNLGKKICDYYNEKAKELNLEWYSSINEKYDLAFLPINSPEGIDYRLEMGYAVMFAKENRKLIIENIKKSLPKPFTVLEEYDVAHNYARLENHFGQNVYVHRKGATSARLGEIGIIPGSQGSYSYIVKGLGNPDSFHSCSHGAGRIMSRKKARELLTVEDEQKKLNGIVHSIRHQKDLDEAPGAYKDITKVMENQRDLVEIVHTLTPLGVIKG